MAGAPLSFLYRDNVTIDTNFPYYHIANSNPCTSPLQTGCYDAPPFSQGAMAGTDGYDPDFGTHMVLLTDATSTRKTGALAGGFPYTTVWAAGDAGIWLSINVNESMVIGGQQTGGNSLFYIYPNNIRAGLGTFVANSQIGTGGSDGGCTVNCTITDAAVAFSQVDPYILYELPTIPTSSSFVPQIRALLICDKDGISRYCGCDTASGPLPSYCKTMTCGASACNPDTFIRATYINFVTDGILLPSYLASYHAMFTFASDDSVTLALAGGALWQANTPYITGDWTSIIKPAGSVNGFMATVAGTTGSSPPSWTACTTTCTDGGVTWTNIGKRNTQDYAYDVVNYTPGVGTSALDTYIGQVRRSASAYAKWPNGEPPWTDGAISGYPTTGDTVNLNSYWMTDNPLLCAAYNQIPWTAQAPQLSQIGQQSPYSPVGAGSLAGITNYIVGNGPGQIPSTATGVGVAPCPFGNTPYRMHDAASTLNGTYAGLGSNDTSNYLNGMNMTGTGQFQGFNPPVPGGTGFPAHSNIAVANLASVNVTGQSIGWSFYYTATSTTNLPCPSGNCTLAGGPNPPTSPWTDQGEVGVDMNWTIPTTLVHVNTGYEASGHRPQGNTSVWSGGYYLQQLFGQMSTWCIGQTLIPPCEPVPGSNMGAITDMPYPGTRLLTAVFPGDEHVSTNALTLGDGGDVAFYVGRVPTTFNGAGTTAMTTSGIFPISTYSQEDVGASTGIGNSAPIDTVHRFLSNPNTGSESAFSPANGIGGASKNGQWFIVPSDVMGTRGSSSPAWGYSELHPLQQASIYNFGDIIYPNDNNGAACSQSPTPQLCYSVAGHDYQAILPARTVYTVTNLTENGTMVTATCTVCPSDGAIVTGAGDNSPSYDYAGSVAYCSSCGFGGGHGFTYTAAKSGLATATVIGYWASGATIGATEPNWDSVCTTTGCTVTDGQITWKQLPYSCNRLRGETEDVGGINAPVVGGTCIEPGAAEKDYFSIYCTPAGGIAASPRPALAPGSGNTGWGDGVTTGWCRGFGICPSLDGTVQWYNVGQNDCRSDLLLVDLMSAKPKTNPPAFSLPAGTSIDWTASGIPSGIPSGSWAQCTTGACATANSAGTAATPTQINAALTACSTAGNEYLLLASGTFTVSSTLNVPANCALRGAGPNLTILHCTMTSGPCVALDGGAPSFSGATAITSGATAGSNSIVVASASGISTGMYLIISQLNDGATVSNAGSEGTCTWCDGGETPGVGSRTQGQIVEVENVQGTTITISPVLYTNYTLTPHATPFSMTKYAGVENLQVYANGTHTNQSTTNSWADFYMRGCAYCWLNRVEGNYSDGPHVEMQWDYRPAVVNSYFSNSYTHTSGNCDPGTCDSDLQIANKTSGALVQNNIFERLHESVMLEWGAAGNVIGYNYCASNIDTGAPNVVAGCIDFHGAHPQFNLIEGNVAEEDYQDSIWGTSADNTVFRNWFQGTAAVCYPIATGRNTVTCGSAVACTSLTANHSCYPFQAVRPMQMSYLTTINNFVGNVVGSANMQALTGYGGMTKSASVEYPSTRSYDGVAYGWTFGYGETGDDGTGTGCSGGTPPCHLAGTSATDYFLGNYNNVTGTISPSYTTLPASLYLSGKPSWWGSLAWPAIGPDVTVGNGPGGHSYLNQSNPAQNCYFNVMGGVDGGAGSPLPFNPTSCGY
jgi:hypothetical protein